MRHIKLVDVGTVAKLAGVPPDTVRRTAERWDLPLTKRERHTFVDGDDIAMLLGMLRHERQEPDGDL